MSAPATAAAMRAVVDAGGPDLVRVMDTVEGRLSELARGHGPALAEHAGSTIAAGGKRLRPLLVCVSAGWTARDPELLVRGATAVELVHAATLVHDDVLDRAGTRRGRPTVVAAAGREAATATGDLLFSRAFAELAGAGSVEAVRELAVACSQLAAGELMQRADAYDTGVSVSRYLERCRCKTAVLFRAACVLGSLAGDGEGERLAVFGERIGLAFQLLDDVLDVAGPPERTGKPRGTDLLDGTVTLPLILARERDPALASLDLRTVRDPVAATAVCDSIAATGALADTRARGLAMVAQAKDGLAGLEYRRRAALELVADGVVDRYA